MRKTGVGNRGKALLIFVLVLALAAVFVSINGIAGKERVAVWENETGRIEIGRASCRERVSTTV